MGLTNRQRDATDNTRSLCVTAGAGAGKTRVLVEKYLRLLDEGTSVAEILAMTFTEKAAAEMRERVREALREKDGGQGRISEEFHWASISTFHSFCASILRDHPLETGIPPGFGVMEEMDSEHLVGRTIERMMTRLDDEEVSKSFTRLMTDFSPALVESFLRTMYRSRYDLERFIHSHPEDLVRSWLRYLENHRREMVSSLLGNPDLRESLSSLLEMEGRCGDPEDRAARYLRETAPLIRTVLECDDISDICRSLTRLHQVRGSRSMGRKDSWSGEELERVRRAYDIVDSTLKGIAEFDLLSVDEDDHLYSAASYLGDLMRCHLHLIGVVGEEKRKANLIDFDDMIAAVRDLLDGDIELAASISNRYRYVLVDEFQDTDVLQNGIILHIVGRLVTGNDRLFIVGDPKQSIYQFRGVDVSLFKRAQDLICEELGGKVIDLDVNFRSAPELIDFCNLLFAQVMPASKKDFEFHYSPMVCSDLRREDSGSVTLLLVDATGGASDEARVIASMIRRTVDEGERTVYWEGDRHLDVPRRPRYGDITILLRTRTNLKHYERALREEGIPFHVHSGMGFFERDEVRDAFNVLSFLRNEEDNLALVGALRSPHFALSDEDILRVADYPGHSFWSKLKRASGDDNERIALASRTLERWRGLVRRISITELMREILLESGVFAVYGGIQGGDQSVANLEKLIDVARRRQGRLETFDEFMEWFQRSIKASPREGLAQMDVGTRDCVNIMTVHAAKGLEFPIVIVPETASRPNERMGLLIPDDEIGLALKIPSFEGGQGFTDTHPRRIVKWKRGERSRAEDRRLFYVACTRAKDHLVISGTRPGKKVEIDHAKTWMDMLVPAIAISDSDIEAGGKCLHHDQREIRIRIEASGVLSAGPVMPRLIEPPGDMWKELQSRMALTRPEIPRSIPVLSPSQMSDYLSDPKGYLERRPTGSEEVKISAERDEARLRGSVVHEVLLGKDAGVAASFHGIADPAFKQEVESIRDEFLRSSLMQELEEDHRELPFRLCLYGHTITGRMDRLVRKKDESWWVIDYKSGRIDDIDKETEKHKVQMEVYRLAAEKLVSDQVSAMIYFTSLNEFREVDRDLDLRRSLKEAARIVGTAGSGHDCLPGRYR